MELKGKVIQEFGNYKVGSFIKGTANLMRELESDGYVAELEEIDVSLKLSDDYIISTPASLQSISKKGRKPREIKE